MKRVTILSTALCLSLMATGCFGSLNTPASESGNQPTDAPTAEETTEAPSAESETSGDVKVSHEVNVETVTIMTYSDGVNELVNVVPKIIVDGEEATEINASLSDYIQKTYPMEKNGDYVDGWSTKIKWGANENTVSIIIYASDTSTDYYTCEVFNYDLDTLTELDDHEVTKRLGMTDEEFFSKTEAIVKKYCDDGRAYDPDKSLEAVNYDKATPFITPDGNPGVSVCLIYSQDTQFMGAEGVRCFNMTTMESGI